MKIEIGIEIGRNEQNRLSWEFKLFVESNLLYSQLYR